MNKHGDLRVWWIPQIPGKSFYVPVDNVVEAALILNTLASYDDFQYKNNIKPDYCNTGGLVVFDSSMPRPWVDWYSVDGEDFDYYLKKIAKYDISVIRRLYEDKQLVWEGEGVS